VTSILFIKMPVGGDGARISTVGLTSDAQCAIHRTQKFLSFWFTSSHLASASSSPALPHDASTSSSPALAGTRSLTPHAAAGPPSPATPNSPTTPTRRKIRPRPRPSCAACCCKLERLHAALFRSTHPTREPDQEEESIREWLFFDKPRRAFDSGNW
jgi:hypothetical protein